MFKKYKNIVFNLIFALLGLSLFLYVFRNFDFTGITEKVQELDVVWVGLILLCSLCSNLARTYRWQQLIEAAGSKAGFWLCFSALSFGYLVNLGIPRLGEVSRCGALQKKSGTSFEILLGTVITERLIDILCLAILTVAVILTQMEFFRSLLEGHLGLSAGGIWEAKKIDLPKLFLFILGCVVFVTVFWFVRNKKIMGNSLYWKAMLFVGKFSKGLRSIFKLRSPLLFLVLTLCIWTMYFFMTYLWFHALPETSVLGATEGLAVMTAGSFAKSLPIQGGGMGAYHFIIEKTLFLFGISSATGKFMGLAIHGFQTLYQMFLGLIGGVHFLFAKEREQLKNPE